MGDVISDPQVAQVEFWYGDDDKPHSIAFDPQRWEDVPALVLQHVSLFGAHCLTALVAKNRFGHEVQRWEGQALDSIIPTMEQANMYRRGFGLPEWRAPTAEDIAEQEAADEAHDVFDEYRRLQLLRPDTEERYLEDDLVCGAWEAALAAYRAHVLEHGADAEQLRQQFEAAEGSAQDVEALRPPWMRRTP